MKTLRYHFCIYTGTPLTKWQVKNASVTRNHMEKTEIINLSILVK